MTENPAASTNDAASLLEAVEKGRASAREVLTHGIHDVELVVLAGFIPAIASRASDNPGRAAFTLALAAMLSVGVVFRIRRLHNLGGSIGTPTLVAMAVVFVMSIVAMAFFEDGARSLVVSAAYAGAFGALAAVYRRALLAGMALFIGIAGVAVATDATPWVFLPALVVAAVVVLFFGRKQFFGPTAV